MNTEIEDIKARVSVREVIAGYMALTKAGVSWKGLCPFHHEKTPSFVVNEERGSWHCFGCGKGGDIFSFVMEMDGLSFPEALALLAERAGVVLEKRGRRFGGAGAGDVFLDTVSHTDEVPSVGIAKERIFKILDLSSKFFEKQLQDGTGKKTALPYLLGRGISNESIRAFRLGYALPGWRTLSDFLAGRGFSAIEIETAGMALRKQSALPNQQSSDSSRMTPADHPTIARMYDRFRDRITFPILDTAGRVIGFSARVLPGADEASAKYINTPETPVYRKSRALYGIFQAKQSIREEGYALFVEGNMDVIAMHQAGFPNTIAVSGTALTEEQLRAVRRSTEKLRLFFDMDSAGQKAARKSTEMALSLGFSVSIVSLPSGKDAAEMAHGDASALLHAVSNPVPAPEYFLSRALQAYDVKTAEGKRRIADDFFELIQRIPQVIERIHWAHALADRIDVPEKTVLALLAARGTPLPSREAASSGASPRLSEMASSAVPFETQSEKLANDIAAVLLACPSLLPLPIERAPERAFSLVANMPILSFLAGETAETFSFAKIPGELKGEASELAFLGEKLLGTAGASESIDREKAGKFFETAWAHFLEELRKEEMRGIERAMRAAHERSDRQEEARLAKRLMDVGRSSAL